MGAGENSAGTKGGCANVWPRGFIQIKLVVAAGDRAMVETRNIEDSRRDERVLVDRLVSSARASRATKPCEPSATIAKASASRSTPSSWRAWIRSRSAFRERQLASPSSLTSATFMAFGPIPCSAMTSASLIRQRPQGFVMPARGKCTLCWRCQFRQIGCGAGAMISSGHRSGPSGCVIERALFARVLSAHRPPCLEVLRLAMGLERRHHR